ncbi:MAG: hypothetical protein LGB01_04930 [Sulfurovum sp.]|nr:hypothetical protein [Sulfurovum sp.]
MMVAPKHPGRWCVLNSPGWQYSDLIAVEANQKWYDKELALSYASAIGGGRTVSLKYNI